MLSRLLLARPLLRFPVLTAGQARSFAASNIVYAPVEQPSGAFDVKKVYFLLKVKSKNPIQWKKEHDIKVDVGPTSIEPEPIMRFENIPNVPQQVLDTLAKDGITVPSLG